jgi:hypothetical protein
MAIERIQPGDPLSAARQNQLIDSLNRLLSAGGGRAPRPPLMWFELAGPLVYPYDTTQCPSSQGAMVVWFDPQQGTYGGTKNAPPATVYHPMALCGSDGHYVGLPAMCAGDRVWCCWNLQSGRWEIVADRGPLCYRAQLLEDLEQGQSAQAVVWIRALGDSTGDMRGATITVYDWFLGPGQALPNGTPIQAQWFPDDRRFYATTAACASGP